MSTQARNTLMPQASLSTAWGRSHKSALRCANLCISSTPAERVASAGLNRERCRGLAGWRCARGQCLRPWLRQRVDAHGPFHGDYPVRVKQILIGHRQEFLLGVPAFRVAQGILRDVYAFDLVQALVDGIEIDQFDEAIHAARGRSTTKPIFILSVLIHYHVLA